MECTAGRKILQSVSGDQSNAVRVPEPRGVFRLMTLAAVAPQSMAAFHTGA